MKNFSQWSIGVFPVCFLFILSSLQAQNPISPPGVYFADPSAHVWNDGKLYVYGSIDEQCAHYCSSQYHVLVTEDMQHWELLENAFASEGSADAVPYNDRALYAPDCAFRRDTFFLYYCQPAASAEGVAVSKNPGGPFRQAQALDVAPYNEIDPSLFIDDDGQAYYLWGQFSLKMARMKPNMRQIDTSGIKTGVLTEQQHHFHEGAFLAKRAGTYYLVYADISREEKPTCIGYATASNPMGPYTYGGVIVDNDGCNPGNWNNHGSIARFGGQWYVFYHRSTHACNTMRKACVEKIRFRPDGSIPEVEMTSQGAAGPLDAKARTEAEWACLLHGETRIRQIAEQEEALTFLQDGDRAVLKYMDFGEGVSEITLRITPGNKKAEITASLEQPWHRTILQAKIPPAENKETWRRLSFRTDTVSGVHAVWFQMHGLSRDTVSLDWFRFQ